MSKSYLDFCALSRYKSLNFKALVSTVQHEVPSKNRKKNRVVHIITLNKQLTCRVRRAVHIDSMTPRV